MSSQSLQFNEIFSGMYVAPTHVLLKPVHCTYSSMLGNIVTDHMGNGS